MLCPICKNVELVMSERCGIEIDYCPNCRGVWLDRGELDKIVERSLAAEPGNAAPMRPSREPGHGSTPGAWHGGHDDRGDHGHHDRGQRRHSFWKDLFD